MSRGCGTGRVLVPDRCDGGHASRKGCRGLLDIGAQDESGGAATPQVARVESRGLRFATHEW